MPPSETQPWGAMCCMFTRMMGGGHLFPIPIARARPDVAAATNLRVIIIIYIAAAGRPVCRVCVMAVDVKSMTKTKPLLPYLICKPSGVLVLSPLALRLSRSSGGAAAAIPGADVHARAHTTPHTHTLARARTYLSIEPCALSHTSSNTHAPLHSSRIFILHTHAHYNCIERPCMYTVNHFDIMCYNL